MNGGGGGGLSLSLDTGKIVEEGILVEILLRLPVKSLIRFKCVCKSWSSLISDPCFARSHLSRGNPNSQKLLFAVHDRPPGKSSSVLKFKTNSEEEEEVAGNDLLVKFKLPKRIRMCNIVGSCHGLLCLDISNDTHTDRRSLVVWNPTTGAFKEIPIPPPPTRTSSWWSNYDFVVLGFGYDAASDDYKILAYIFDDEEEEEETYEVNAVIFAIKENYWRSVCVRHLKSIPSRSGVYLNGFFHWLEWSHEVLVSFVDTESTCSILSFDFSNEKFEVVIPLPPDMVTRGFIELAIFRGCLFIYTEYYRHSCVKCWIMEEHGSWTKLCDFTCQSRDRQETRARVVSSCTTVGKVLLHIRAPESMLCLYSPEDNSFQFAPFGKSVLYDAQLYVESLVSP